MLGFMFIIFRMECKYEVGALVWTVITAEKGFLWRFEGVGLSRISCFELTPP